MYHAERFNSSCSHASCAALKKEKKEEENLISIAGSCQKNQETSKVPLTCVQKVEGCSCRWRERVCVPLCVSLCVPSTVEGGLCVLLSSVPQVQSALHTCAEKKEGHICECVNVHACAARRLLSR